MKVLPELRRNRYPDKKYTKQIAEIMRAVARDIDP
jgi:CspA family cold shock protein